MGFRERRKGRKGGRGRENRRWREEEKGGEMGRRGGGSELLLDWLGMKKYLLSWTSRVCLKTVIEKNRN